MTDLQNRIEYGNDAQSLAPGDLFRFEGEEQWFLVYDTYGCCCGDGPWECGACRSEHAVVYGTDPNPTFDYKSGEPFGPTDAIQWEGFDDIPCVEVIRDASEIEKAELLHPALPSPNPNSRSETNARE
jgi:hypothetical protein